MDDHTDEQTREAVRQWIARLSLRPHPEGGYFAETYRSQVELSAACLPAGYGSGGRPAATAIYYLLTGDTFSAFHRLRSDELWHFYTGHALEIYQLRPEARPPLHTTRLGIDPHAAAQPQALVPAGCWFAARVLAPDGYALVGCTVSPGFDFADFELGSRKELTGAYPQHADLIHALTRQND